MIYVKLVVECEGVFDEDCSAKKECLMPAFRLDTNEHDWDIPEGWGWYLSSVLCPKCLKRVIKKYGKTAVSS